MGNILKAISLQKSHPLTEKSSFMTVQSEMKLAEHKTPYSQTPTDSPDSIQQSSCLMESNLIMLGPAPSSQLTKPPKLKYVTASTPPMAVETQQTIAASNMPASGASTWATERNIAMAKRDLAHEICPKYLRYNIWNRGKHFSHSSADWTETATPLPSIPASELANPIATKTINENPHLFDTMTLIFVDRFEELLQSHPNQQFVNSVCRGL